MYRNKNNKNRIERVRAQVVEHLSCMCEALGSIPVLQKRINFKIRIEIKTRRLSKSIRKLEIKKSNCPLKPEE
jgi:hypothetical protein